MKKKDEKRSELSVEEWADKQTFESTADIEIPAGMADRVIGQDEAVEVMRKAASQKRHVMLIGEPGTGKSMLANSMVEELSPEDLQDIVSYHNPEDFNEPRIRTFPAGRGKAVVAEQKAAAAARKNQSNTFWVYACMGLIILGLLGAFMFNNFTIALVAMLGAFIIIMLFKTPMQQRNDTAIVPKLLVGHDPGETPPFVDATGTHAGALLGDVRHDPFQSGGLETPSHDRIEAGAIHKANKGVLYIDEINVLRMESQQALLTAMQEKQMSITGQSERSSGALVKSEPVPCDFILVCAGNLDAIQGMHPALRSRIRGYGYEVYMRNTMHDTDENRSNIARFVAQEVKKDGKIPAFDKYAVGEIVREAQRRSGKKGELTLRMRELGGLIRVSGDIAYQRGSDLVTVDDVVAARRTARSIEQQIADRYIESSAAYSMFRTEGSEIGMINGLAALNASSNMAEYSGIVLPIVAEVSPSQVRKGGRIIATGQLGTIAKEAVDNISAVIKKYTMTNLSDSDIHLQYIGTYDGVEGDSASITMATVIISALERIPIRQDLAMTGSLSVRGKVLPVGGVTAKLEAAAASGIKIALIPKDNGQDVMIENRYYKTMEVYTVETLRDVFEYAFVDCPMKQQYMDKLLPLNEGGVSTVKKIDPPKEWEGKIEHRTEHKKKVHEEAPAEDPVVSDDASPDIVPPNLGRGPTDPLKPFRG
ncbi:MAG: ATP-dependent protease LonB [Candidatus Methanomethylophilaceae archaeon]|nr:ATP-dependent protease LonB [Candidatus Methanomethylophilaceae archaeon]